MRITAKYLKSVYEDGTYGLRDVNFDIADGSFTVVVGASGCGKTTLLKVLAGLCPQTAGELYFDGKSVAGVAAMDREISMVFQEYLLYPKYTVWENLSLALEREVLSRDEEEDRINAALNMFGVLDLSGQLPRVLSGGQQQRVALAKAVVTRPKAVLFDEPLANVAEAQRAEYVQTLKQLKASLPNTTFVYVTHKLSEALQLADRLVVMKNGKVLQYGSVEFVTHNPYSEEVLDSLTDDELKRDGDTVYNPYSKTWQLFGGDGPTDGEKAVKRFVANFDGKIAAFEDGGSFTVDENFSMRFCGKLGSVQVVVPTQKIHDVVADGDIELPLQNESGIADNKPDECKKSFVSADDVSLVDMQGCKIMSHYRLYSSSAYGKVVFGKLRLPCGTVPLGSDVKGGVHVEVKPLAIAHEAKHGIVVEKCLDEESWNGGKLCYCMLKGFDHYVSLILPSSVNLFVGKHRITIEEKYLKVTRR